MTRPWKHPKTGMYWLRKAVPKDLQASMGKREIVCSLRTRDAGEAKILLVEQLAALDRRFATLRAGIAKPEMTSKTLNEREAHESAQWMFGHWLSLHRDNPSRQTFWFTSLYPKLWQPRSLFDTDLPSPMAPTVPMQEFFRLSDMEVSCQEQADDSARAQGWQLDDTSRMNLTKAIAASLQRASLQLAAEAMGHAAPSFDSISVANGLPGHRPASGKPVSIKALLAEWWCEAQATGRKQSTFESYRGTVASFVAFLQHDDARRVAAQDVVAYKDHRLRTPSPKTGRVPSAKTVKDSDLAAQKTIFGWATRNRKIEVNPAAGITIKLGKLPRTRLKGFTDEEAVAILTAALRHEGGEELPCTAAAKRWVPWLCAFTGARVGEMAQLRKEDVMFKDGHLTVRITPEAGTVKTNQFREVVLHSRVVALGFTKFVAESGDGHLFVSLSDKANMCGKLKGLTNRLAQFARDIVPDPALVRRTASDIASRP